MPRIVIAGTHSGCGKTTIASGIMSALVARGLTVQPFKVGPDFIDPTHHTSICRRASRNLDPYMMGEDGVLDTFCRASEGADIAVIEGVMGMYDGLEGSALGSTADVAKILDAPVILVVDVKGMSRSANAVVAGFRSFDRDVNLAGVIFNRVGSMRHSEMIRESLGLPALGWIPWQRESSTESRHLGLRMAHEDSGMSAFGEVIKEHCDLDAIMALASSAPQISSPSISRTETDEIRVKIGVASDEAFCFYYQENLDLLRRSGAELVFFSPMKDHLPEVDLLYLGGGYPELHANLLEKGPCRLEIREAANNGMPVYAECGGLVYLCESLTYDTESEMAGVLPARAVMKERFQALGYVDATCTSGRTLLRQGLHFRGHEFHNSVLECDADARFAICLSRGRGIKDGRDGLCEQNVLAGYTHACFSEDFSRDLVEKARQMR